MESLAELLQERDEIKAGLAKIGNMRPGSLLERYRKCGKPTCHCAQLNSPLHGPIWTLTWKSKGKTIAKILRDPLAIERTKAHIQEFNRFRTLSRRLVEVSERICNLELQSPEADADATIKKGASESGSSPRSPGKSPPS